MEKDSRARLRNSPSLKRGERLEGGSCPSSFSKPPPSPESPAHPSDQLLQERERARESEEKEGGDLPPKGFGEKSISFFGSCALNFNNITGPTMVVLPLLFQQAGWLLPTLSLIVMWVFSSFAATMLCEAMQRIPGNKNFGRRYEYCTLVRHYFGHKWYAVAMIAYNVGLVASNIAAMIVASQVLDSLLSRIIGTTFGVDYATWPPAWKTQAGFDHRCQWGETKHGNCISSVITLGYLFAAGVCIPLGFLSLEDNMFMQWLSMVGQLSFSFCFIAIYIHSLVPQSSTFCSGNGLNRTPVVGVDISQVVGISVFSYAYVSTIPSWVNEKRGGVSVNRAVWVPSLAAVCLNITLAFLGAWSFKLLDKTGYPLDGTENILNVLVARAAKETTCHAGKVPFTVEISAYSWGLLGYLPGIPILSIMVRYNLMNGSFLPPSSSFFLGVVAPWLVTAFFYQAEVLLQFCNWMAILFQGFINFVVPALLYRASIFASEDLSPRPIGQALFDIGKNISSDSKTTVTDVAMEPRQSLRNSLIRRQELDMDIEEQRDTDSLLEPNTIIFEETGVSGVEIKPVSKMGNISHVISDNMPRKLSSIVSDNLLKKYAHENGPSFMQSVERRSVGNLTIEMVQLMEENKESESERERERGRQELNESLQSVQFPKAKGNGSPNKEEEIEEAVNAIPGWFPLTPLVFSKWMAIGLGSLVIIIIVDSIVQVIKPWAW